MRGECGQECDMGGVMTEIGGCFDRGAGAGGTRGRGQSSGTSREKAWQGREQGGQGDGGEGQGRRLADREGGGQGGK